MTDINDLIIKFPKWRKICAEQLARGNPYCSYLPEAKDVIAMMDTIERLRSEHCHG